MTKFIGIFKYSGLCECTSTPGRSSLHFAYAPYTYLREPHDFLHRSRVMATERAETFTLLVDPKAPGSDKISFHGEERQLKRAKDLGLVIDRFAKDLPAQVNLTFTKHDQPACALGYQHRERLLELAAEGDCE